MAFPRRIPLPFRAAKSVRGKYTLRKNLCEETRSDSSHTQMEGDRGGIFSAMEERQFT